MVGKSKGSHKKSPKVNKWRMSHEQVALEVLGPSPNVLQYFGPVKFQFETLQLSTYTTVIAGEAALSSDAGGSIASVWTNSPNVSGVWGSIANLFDEYRTLAFRVEYYPHNKYNRGVSVTTQPILVVLDMDNSTALTSYTSGTYFSSAKMFTMDDKWVYEGKMSGVTDGQFITTASPTPFAWIKSWATGLTASTNYGLLLFYWRVQLRAIGQ